MSKSAASHRYRAVTPDFGALAERQYWLEGAFRRLHTRLRAHAESVAFFGGGAREGAAVDAAFLQLQACYFLPIARRSQWWAAISVPLCRCRCWSLTVAPRCCRSRPAAPVQCVLQRQQQCAQGLLASQWG